jgi:hypothetical protein
MLNKLIFTALAVLLMTMGGLSTAVAGPAFGGGCGGKGICGDDLAPLSTEEADGLKYMREEERLSRDIYRTMADKWGLIVFTNIARSEDKHMLAVKHLLDKYEVADPVKDDEQTATTGDDFTNDNLGDLFDEFKQRGMNSMMEALQVGGEIEEIDLRDLLFEIDQTDNDDIISTYEHLVCGAFIHLRAYVRQIEIRGEAYEPVYLTLEELSTIVDSPIARKCGSKQKKQGKK